MVANAGVREAPWMRLNVFTRSSAGAPEARNEGTVCWQ